MSKETGEVENPVSSQLLHSTGKKQRTCNYPRTYARSPKSLNTPTDMGFGLEPKHLHMPTSQMH